MLPATGEYDWLTGRTFPDQAEPLFLAVDLVLTGLSSDSTAVTARGTTPRLHFHAPHLVVGHTDVGTPRLDPSTHDR